MSRDNEKYASLSFEEGFVAQNERRRFFIPKDWTSHLFYTNDFINDFVGDVVVLNETLLAQKYDKYIHKKRIFSLFIENQSLQKKAVFAFDRVTLVKEKILFYPTFLEGFSALKGVSVGADGNIIEYYDPRFFIKLYLEYFESKR